MHKTLQKIKVSLSETTSAAFIRKWGETNHRWAPWTSDALPTVRKSIIIAQEKARLLQLGLILWVECIWNVPAQWVEIAAASNLLGCVLTSQSFAPMAVNLRDMGGEIWEGWLQWYAFCFLFFWRRKAILPLGIIISCRVGTPMLNLVLVILKLFVPHSQKTISFS